MRDVAVIDYGMGNLRSVVKAWEAVGARSRLVASPAQIDDKDILVFPGQGAIVDAMALLKEKAFDALIKNWIADDRPFFGICLGLQALFSHSEEGKVDTLGIFEGSVRRFKLDSAFKVPHMGWNGVDFLKPSKFLEGIENFEPFYFVHSYFVDTSDSEIIFGKTEYGGREFVSAIQKGRLLATQFHPEKSQSKGLKLYSNFLKYV